MPCLIQSIVRSAFLLLAFIVASTAGAANSYTYTDLGTLGGTFSSAAAINNVGQVTGYSNTSGDADQRAYLWSSGSMNELSSVGSFARPASINDAGQVVGTTGGYRPFLWSAGITTDLGSLGGLDGVATSINNAGQVVGYSTDAANVSHGFYWNGSSMTAISAINGGHAGNSTAISIDNAGKVAGSYSGLYFPYTYLWYGATADPTLLGSSFAGIAGLLDNPKAMSSSGEYIAGYTSTSAAALFQLGGPLGLSIAITPLGALPDTEAGEFLDLKDVNDAGQVVGSSFKCIDDRCDIPSRAFLWDDGTIVDLDSYLDADTLSAGWHLWNASGINENGWIVGDAYNTITGAQHAFLLTPVPEPEVYAMMIAGLGFLGWARRKQQHVRVA